MSVGYSFRRQWGIVLPRMLWNADYKFWFPQKLGSMFEPRTPSCEHHFLIATNPHVDGPLQTPTSGKVRCCIGVEGVLGGTWYLSVYMNNLATSSTAVSSDSLSMLADGKENDILVSILLIKTSIPLAEKGWSFSAQREMGPRKTPDAVPWAMPGTVRTFRNPSSNSTLMLNPSKISSNFFIKKSKVSMSINWYGNLVPKPPESSLSMTSSSFEVLEEISSASSESLES